MKVLLRKSYYLILLILFSCYGVNEKTSHIVVFIPYCAKTVMWDDLSKRFTKDSISDLEFINKVAEFKKMPFESKLLYFKDEPSEIIGLDASHIGIRYVYNPKISSKILDGLSPELKKVEKRRIRNRVLSLYLEYQCEQGKKKTIEEMKKEIEE